MVRQETQNKKIEGGEEEGARKQRKRERKIE